jgi:hypothetical protein
MEVSGQLHASAALPSVPNWYEAGWAPEPVYIIENKYFWCQLIIKVNL